MHWMMGCVKIYRNGPLFGHILVYHYGPGYTVYDYNVHDATEKVHLLR